MPRRRCAVCCLVLFLIVGNAAVVQVVAWAGMIAVRSAESGVAAAVASTFSGAAPCRLCRAAAAMERPQGIGTGGEQVLQKLKKIDAGPAGASQPEPVADVASELVGADVVAACDASRPAPEPPPPRC
ncbi:MAG: hypothetical protein J0M02_11980 [Planctomycetes bacterium]|nr:hypothetical protein [Planctomycetota bacterium]